MTRMENRTPIPRVEARANEANPPTTPEGSDQKAPQGVHRAPCLEEEAKADGGSEQSQAGQYRRADALRQPGPKHKPQGSAHENRRDVEKRSGHGALGR